MIRNVLEFVQRLLSDMIEGKKKDAVLYVVERDLPALKDQLLPLIRE